MNSVENGIGTGAKPAGDDREKAARDWWPVAAEWSDEDLARHLPARVARPATIRDAKAALAEAASAGMSVVARGAGSGVVGGAIGVGGHLCLDLSALDSVKIDPARSTVTAGAGVMAGALEARLNEEGFTLGHYPQSLHLASVGGLVATRSSGTFSNKYGGIERLVEGLRVLLADGSEIDFRAVPRSSTGPWLLPMFIGSEGSLGIILEVTLRIFRRAEKRAFGGYAFPDLAAAIRTVEQGYARHVVPAVSRIYDHVEAQTLYGRMGLTENRPLLIAGHDGATAIVDAEKALFAEIALENGADWLGEEIGNAWEAHRYNADWLIRGNEGPGRMADAIEVAAAWPDLVALNDTVRQAVAADCAQFMAHLSHFYPTGGAIYFIFTLEEKDSAAAISKYRSVWQRVMELTLKHNGSISHHHGVGLARADMLPAELGSAHELLALVKKALDPQGLLNPGKLGLKG